MNGRDITNTSAILCFFRDRKRGDWRREVLCKLKAGMRFERESGWDWDLYRRGIMIKGCSRRMGFLNEGRRRVTVLRTLESTITLLWFRNFKLAERNGTVLNVQAGKSNGYFSMSGACPIWVSWLFCTWWGFSSWISLAFLINRNWKNDALMVLMSFAPP